ncbi:MAG: winged helix-turn-helix transcriptional regulator [Chloroflexota bacterium]
MIGALAHAPRRLGQLERAAGGVSAKVLTQTLRALERDGLLMRTIYAEIPSHTEYELTSLGRDLIDPLAALRRWAERTSRRSSRPGPRLARCRRDGRTTERTELLGVGRRRCI